MNSPALVILAAGMGSRFGGLKQITPVDDRGHAIIDFSLYDAYRAGFRKVVFIIKHEIEDNFKAIIGSRMEKHFDVSYVFQELDALPAGYSVPEGRVKPWGTAHAVSCCAPVLKGTPFAVINSDDFYGASAYSAILDFLKEQTDPSASAMVAYLLRNTVTENGTVARGICDVKDGYLESVTETLNIAKDGENAVYPDASGNMVRVSGETPVSMNMWGFGPAMMEEYTKRFSPFLDKALKENPLKAEYFIPSVASAAIEEGKTRVRVLNCEESWYGITYREDMPSVVSAIAGMRAEGLYPDELLE